MSDYREITDEDMALARRAAPNLDESGLGIFVGSGLFDMLYRQPNRNNVRKRGEKKHDDVTGIYQRGKSK